MCLTGKAKMIHVKDVPKLGREDPPPGVIRAWRAWKLEGGKLRSTYQSTSWPTGSPMSSGGKSVKTDPTTYGVHAVKRIEDVHLVGTFAPADRSAVIGEILLWGDVAEHDNGYRAEYGYPFRLWTNDFLATSTLRDAYGVAVEIKSVSELLAEHPRKR
jgi:hypothetical protein